MSFISYAQNFEDVVLWRALKGVNSGFYIDVGAADPHEISVTKAFYDQGWSGINIEPTPIYFERLVRARPRDLNLNVAAGAAPGLMVLNQISGTGLSTSDGDVARRHAEAGWQSLELTVPMLTLTSICESQEMTEIHFLKVDVEGAEADVLRGMDFSRFRPWIIVAEATKPLSSERAETSYEGLLLEHGYQRAYFDGLNMFYVADEHADLAHVLAAPPNVFDNYVTVREHDLDILAGERSSLIDNLSQRGEQQEAELAALRSAVEQERTARDEAESQLAALRQEVGESREIVQRVSLHNDQLKRRLSASYNETEQHRESSRALRLEFDEALAERDALRMEQDAMKPERDALLVERDAVVAERDALLLARDTAMATRDSQAGRLRELDAAAARLAQEQDRLQTAHVKVTSLLDAVRVSTSWRLTRPIRIVGRAVKAGLQRPGT